MPKSDAVVQELNQSDVETLAVAGVAGFLHGTRDLWFKVAGITRVKKNLHCFRFLLTLPNLQHV
jgi:hypothetical protein